MAASSVSASSPSAASGSSHDTPTKIVDNTLCAFTADDLKNLRSRYYFPADIRVLPAPLGCSTTDCPSGFVPVYARYFSDGNLRFPVSRFFCSVFELYNMELAQLNPLGVCRIVCFEMQCRALGVVPHAVLFKHFFGLAHAGNFYNLAARRSSKNRPAPSCFLHVPNCCKDWKKSFFWVGAEAFPVSLPKLAMDPRVRVYDEPAPEPGTYNVDDAALLSHKRVRCRVYSSSALAFCRVSIACRHPELAIAFKRTTEAERSRIKAGEKLDFSDRPGTCKFSLSSILLA